MRAQKFAVFVSTLLLSVAAASFVWAQAEAADAFVKRISNDVLDSVKADSSPQAGDTGKVIALVNAKVMPFLNFERMTASAVGKYWRQATPVQQRSLQEEFKTLLVRTYAGALAQARDQRIELKPLRGSPADKELVVRTEVRGNGEPVQLDYRVEQTDAGWKIYDVNVMGVWLVENYRGSFSQEIGSIGIDGLISKLRDKNKASVRN